MDQKRFVKIILVVTTVAFTVVVGYFIYIGTKQVKQQPPPLVQNISSDNQTPTTTPSQTSTPNKKQSFIKINIPPEWEKANNYPLLKPIVGVQNNLDLSPIPVYVIKNDPPVIFSGSNSENIKEISVIWIPINSGKFISPETDWRKYKLENFKLGDKKWIYEASSLKENLGLIGDPQQYTFRGITRDGEITSDYVIVYKVSTEKDYDELAQKRNLVNKPIVEGLNIFAGNFERYNVITKETLNQNLTAYLLGNNLDYCQNNFSTFINLQYYCDRDIIYLTLFNKQENKNYYLKAYQLNIDGVFGLEYIADQKTLYVKHGAMSAENIVDKISTTDFIE